MKASRQFLAATLLAAASLNALADAANDEKMKKLAATAGCITCHTVSASDGKDGKKPIGPAWADVSKQYRGKPGAAEFLTRVILEGSNPYASHWKGKVTGIAMPPNAVAISEGDTRQLVYWILSLN